MRNLEFRDVSVTYHKGRSTTNALQGVSLVVRRGSVMGLVGESGCGKSTLARTAVGLAPITHGAVSLGDANVSRLSRRDRGRIQMVFQDPYASLDPRQSTGSSISEPLLCRGQRRRPARDEVPRLLQLVGLSPSVRDKLPSALSGGQRQRVAFARALAADPEVIIADEVTSALDVSVQSAILNLIRTVHANTDVSILFISHNLPVVRYVSDEIAVMRAGQIVEVTRPDRFGRQFEHHEYTSRLIEAIPDLA